MHCESVRSYPTNRMLGERENANGKAGRYRWLTYKQVYELVLKVGNSLRHCGVAQGDKCGIYGGNCSKWVISMQACNAYGLQCVPLYDTLGATAVEYIICHAGISVVFVEETKIPEVLKTLTATRKYLKTLVSLGNVELSGTYDLQIYSWDDFLTLGLEQRYELPIKQKSDICTIMYTSGTTGDPKGVMISNESILSIISGVNHHLESIDEKFTEEDVYVSYLPLAHIFDRVIEELMIFVGASIGFWQKDVKKLMDDIKELRPTALSAVPRVLERIHSGLVEKISSAGFLKSALFNIAYSYKLWNMSRGFKQVDSAPLFDKIIFNKVKEGLGGNLRLILSGAAHGNSYESFLVAVVNPNIESLERWGEEKGMGGDFGTLCTSPMARVYILEEVAKIGREKKLKGFEIIKAVHLDALPFDMERQLLSPTYKKKRVQFLKYYQDAIEDMYTSVKSS